ncbi:hypothetical protein NG799_12395 [Laspinema sp. D1]|uniref:YbjN domain-containing protein n=1 Tax=Laspinema palackyanum D2a TaxID=2953684 RepID=A0ABT2MQX6_9CYAN|nr:hypothetical protein [Laspinema sp. D2b]MCT7967139.1 hypothetical protein [Laspinema sp. D2a]
MATTLAEIGQYLDNRGWNYDLQEANSQIITGYKAENVEQFLMVIQLQEEGEYLSVFVPELLQVKDHVYKGVVFQTMLAIAWSVKFLRWEYDPRDGEIRASIGFALEDAALTERQFNRVLNALIHLVDEVAMPRLQAVLATGNDPGDPEMEQDIAAALAQLLPEGSLEALQPAIASRLQSRLEAE